MTTAHRSTPARRERSRFGRPSPGAGRKVNRVLLLLLVCAGGERALAADGPDILSQRVYSPIELTHGQSYGVGEPRPATASASVMPSIGLGPVGRVRLGVAGNYSWVNPGWRIAGGPRLALRIWSLSAGSLSLGEVGLYLDGRMLFEERGEQIIQIGSAFSLDDLLHLGIRYSHVADRAVDRYELTLGFGLLRWIHVLDTEERDPFGDEDDTEVIDPVG